jgi:long-chain acyl-CoA synthetase
MAAEQSGAACQWDTGTTSRPLAEHLALEKSLLENALAQHPSVAACAVIGIPSAEWGEAVHAIVVPKPGAGVGNDELVAHCRTLIAGYKCPRTIEQRDALPLSGTGKILKTELRKPFWAGRDTRIG